MGKSFPVIELAKQLKAIGKNVVVTATTVIASQGLRQKLPEHVGAVSTIHKFVGLKHGRFENDELLNLIVHDENFVVWCHAEMKSGSSCLWIISNCTW
jgi:hypothetical protein